MSFVMSSDNSIELDRACFNVVERPVYSVTGSGDVVEAIDKKMLCKIDPEDGSEKYMSVVNKTYKVIENGPVLTVVLGSVKKFFAPSLIEGLQIKTTLQNNGGTTLVEMKLPNISTTVETTNGFVTHLYYRNILRNTFDGKGALRLYTGNIDMFCTNGMISGEYTVLSESHRSLFKEDSFSELLETTCENYMSVTDRVVSWAKKKVDTSNVVDFFNHMVHGNKEPSGRANDLASNLVEQYHREASVRGNNLFALTSAMTHYASHSEGAFEVRKSTRNIVPVTAKLFERQEKVRKWIDSDSFKMLEAA